ncbi:hypothetical protein FB382_001788 [Nocardioides ginsengisegetis]|uniref:Metallo-peptidase family M12B Reprolysin-like n=1 Tax=Nocardioides ginsengisegetis TaxID=661491 RepID=A0A7W3IZI9_9ACTN|nr:hypothetical protein [Nocardioides ginsengisegetis]MBA8803497.1 hypothetical protein [Nocardioides ginsengisegetis]
MHTLGNRTSRLGLGALVAAVLSLAPLAPVVSSAGTATTRSGLTVLTDPVAPPAPAPSALGQSALVPLPAPLRDTFALDSRPGSSRTLFLKFTGGTVAGTAFNADFGLDSITARPWSITPPVDTNFSPTELAEIQRAWQVTAEDFAPFDVNVTTRTPAPDALDRSSDADASYGATVLVTQGGPLQAACRCGGLAYGNVFGAVGAAKDYAQPAFVFGSYSGEDIGEGVSHEAGHLFGLMHDGTATLAYYDGRAPWSPIMGSSFSQPVSQWSLGEYPGANNTQDDVAIIARSAPIRPDDHGDTAATATPLVPGTVVNGVITTRTDVDAFIFTASGPVTLTASTLAVKADLDVGLRITDAAGNTVATVDAPTTRDTRLKALGLGATWTATLPRTPATYVAYVDGVGTGSPTTPGRYSDYGSLGTYRLLLLR